MGTPFFWLLLVVWIQWRFGVFGMLVCNLVGDGDGFQRCWGLESRLGVVVWCCCLFGPLGAGLGGVFLVF